MGDRRPLGLMYRELWDGSIQLQSLGLRSERIRANGEDASRRGALAFLFRYPVVKKDDGHLILRGALVYPAEVLKIIETISVRMSGPVVMAWLDAVKGGSFPTETWHMGPPAPGQN
jgi:hypothetical protein